MADDDYMASFDEALEASIEEVNARSTPVPEVREQGVAIGLIASSSALKQDLGAFLAAPDTERQLRTPVKTVPAVAGSGASRAARSKPSAASASLLVAHSVYTCPMPSLRIARPQSRIQARFRKPRASLAGGGNQGTSLQAIDELYGAKPRSVSPLKHASPVTKSQQPAVSPLPTSQASAPAFGRLPGSSSRPSVPNPFHLSQHDTHGFRKSEGDHKALMASWLTPIPTRAVSSGGRLSVSAPVPSHKG